MHSSTSNSKSWKYPIGAAGAFLCALTVLAILGRYHPDLAEAWGDRRDYTVPDQREYYLDYVGASTISHATIFSGNNGTLAPLKQSDVLFLGSSRHLFALPQEILAPKFQSWGLSYYLLCFGHDERDRFPREIFERFELSPKWVVVDCGRFFNDRQSAVAQIVSKVGGFYDLKNRFELATAERFRQSIHSLIPPLGQLTQSEFRPPLRIYRSRLDGTWKIEQFVNTNTPIPPEVTPEKPHLDPGELRNAQDFLRQMESRGTQLILTCVPPYENWKARLLGEALDVPVVLPELTGLHTRDGAHLTEEDGVRFAQSLLTQLEPILSEP